MPAPHPLEPLRVALVQMRSGRDVARNVADAAALIREAAGTGARYIQTPEMTTLMELDRERLLASVGGEERNPALEHFSRLAAELDVWLHIGSMAILRTDGRLANRGYLFAPDGHIAARYDKIHLFDVELANGESYKESRNYAPGEAAIVAATPWGGLGLTICYDLRFPQLYRALAKAGAVMIAVPAAFTKPTGEAHWHTLLRARAIETQCFVAAAAQGGRHETGRDTYGHSLVVSPWGEILGEGGIEPGIITADLDWDALRRARASLPSLDHDRAFKVE